MAEKKPSVPMTISVRCSGQTIIIGIYEHEPGEGEGVNPKYTYTVMGNTNPGIEPFATDEEPIGEGGRVSGWFHKDVIDRLFSDAKEEDQNKAWLSFCMKYLKRADKITSWVQVLQRTERVVSYPHRILEITIDGHTCHLEGNQVLKPKFFVEWFVYRFNSLVVISGAYWAEVVTHWLDDAEEGEEQESLAPGMGCIESVLNHIRKKKKVMTTTKEEMKKNPNLPWFDEGVIKLSGKVIETKARESKIELRLLNSLMKDYLCGPAKQTRVGDLRINFWQFNPEKLGIDIQKTLKESEEEESEEDTDGEE